MKRGTRFSILRHVKYYPTRDDSKQIHVVIQDRKLITVWFIHILYVAKGFAYSATMLLEKICEIRTLKGQESN